MLIFWKTKHIIFIGGDNMKKKIFITILFSMLLLLGCAKEEVKKEVKVIGFEVVSNGDTVSRNLINKKTNPNNAVNLSSVIQIETELIEVVRINTVITFKVTLENTKSRQIQSVVVNDTGTEVFLNSSSTINSEQAMTWEYTNPGEIIIKLHSGANPLDKVIEIVSVKYIDENNNIIDSIVSENLSVSVRVDSIPYFKFDISGYKPFNKFHMELCGELFACEKLGYLGQVTNKIITITVDGTIYPVSTDEEMDNILNITVYNSWIENFNIMETVTEIYVDSITYEYINPDQSIEIRTLTINRMITLDW